jgi:trimethylamine--corrinoid protein Co-methyltransferase
MGKSHLVMHAAGWLEGGLSASMEKMVIDAEMLRGWTQILAPIAFSDDDLGVEAIKDTPPGGHFFGSTHTLARYETAFYRPLLSDWSNFENWRDAGAKDATQRAHAIWKKLRDEYVAPPLDPAIAEAVDAYVAKRCEEIGR